jgi:hypothetical protein
MRASGANFPYGNNPWKEFPGLSSTNDSRVVLQCTTTDQSNNVTAYPKGIYIPFPSDTTATSTPMPSGFHGIVEWQYQLPGCIGIIRGGSDVP